MKSAKFIFLRLASLLGLVGASSSSEAAESIPTGIPLQAHSPLSANSTNAGKIAQALKDASGGSVTATSVTNAIQEVHAKNPGISMPAMASSLNQLGLDKNGIKNAVLAMAQSFGVSESQAASALITETYMNGGSTAANKVVASLKESLGVTVVENAMDNASDTVMLGNNEDSFNNDTPYYG
jgi:hypothetical protein